jgi:uncharacterized protein
VNMPSIAHGRGPDHALRNPMVWLVVCLPAMVVVAAFATLMVAIRAGGSDALPDEVRRIAQIQTTDLGADDYAAQHRLSAVLRVGADGIEVFTASGDALRDAAMRREPLVLSLQHPSRAAEDRTLRLQPTASGWRSAMRLDSSHDWRIRLADVDARWRLHGRLPKTGRSALLQPALDASAPTMSPTTHSP